MKIKVVAKKLYTYLKQTVPDKGSLMEKKTEI